MSTAPFRGAEKKRCNKNPCARILHECCSRPMLYLHKAALPPRRKEMVDSLPAPQFPPPPDYAPFREGPFKFTMGLQPLDFQILIIQIEAPL